LAANVNFNDALRHV